MGESGPASACALCHPPSGRPAVPPSDAAPAGDLLALLKRIGAVDAIEARHYEFCIAADNCTCLTDAADLEAAVAGMEALFKWEAGRD